MKMSPRMIMLGVAAAGFIGAAIAPAIAAASYQRHDYDAVIADVQRMAMKSWPLSDVVWPGAAYGSRSAVYVFDDRAVEMTVDGIREVDRDAIDKLSPAYPGWSYFYADFAGRRAIIVKLKEAMEVELSPAFPPEADAARRVFRFVSHEIFHDVQARNAWSPPRPDQFHEYPTRQEWSLWRAYIYEELHRALSDEATRERHLKNAAFWYARFVDLYGRLVPSASSEVLEGTAQYMELQLMAAADITDPTDSAARIRQSLAYVYDWRPGLHSYLIGRGGTDAYLLGALANAVLESSPLPWRAEIAEGRTPLDTLLFDHGHDGRYEPIAAIDETNIAMIGKLNVERHAQLQPLIDLYHNVQSPRLALPSLLTLVPDPLLADEVEEAHKQTNPNVAGEFRGPLAPPLQGSWVGGYRVADGSLLIKNRAIVASFADPVYSIPLAEGEYTLSGNRLTLSSGTLSGQFNVQIENDDQGRQIFVPTPSR